MKIAPRFFSRKHRGPRLGFTLIEMLITMAIFILLCAAVFGIITGVLQGASTLQDNQNHRDQTVALNAYLKKNLAGLSAQSTLQSYRRGDGEGLVQNGMIFADDSKATAIDAKIQPNGYYLLRTTYITPANVRPNGPGLDETLRELVTTDAPSLNWAPLIHDIKTLSWKFQEPNATQWTDLWNPSATKPNLIEFTFQQGGDLKPTAMDFWVPHLEKVTLNPPSTNAP